MLHHQSDRYHYSTYNGFHLPLQAIPKLFLIKTAQISPEVIMGIEGFFGHSLLFIKVSFIISSDE